MTVGLIVLESFLGPLAPEHLSEFVVGVVLAVLVAVGVQKFAVPRFEKMYADRTDQIQGSINRAQQIQAEADQKRREYETQLASSHDEAAQMRDKARSRASEIVAEADQKAKAQYERLLEQARAQIETERVQAFHDLKSDLGQIAVQLAERIVVQKLNDDASVSATVDTFLDELEAEPSRTAPDYPPVN